MGKIRVSLVLAALVTALVAPPVGAARPEAVKGGKSDVYVVLLSDAPVLAYTGGVKGIPATQPAEGVKVTRKNANAERYSRHLVDRHNQVLSAAGIAGTAKFYDYTWALNGFAAVLTPAEVRKLSARDDVIRVERDVLQEVQTDNSPTFLGLDSADGGLWAEHGLTGEDVIIGVIDTGIWPEHPSFSDQEDLADRPGNSGKRLRAYGAPPAQWAGTCQAGEAWSVDDCNNKLIGARYFLSGFGKHGIDPKGDYKSARDHDGHGTHTASTAGGNAGVAAEIFGVPFGTVSGIAPRARIAAYKALWNNDGGFTSDLSAAIDAAVADGVDVINYSIGSASPGFTGADDIAFLIASQAGVHVATSAGNDGPGASTIGSPSGDPWVTTVGASTQDRTFEATATLGDGTSVTGASVTEAAAESPLVDSVDVGLAGADPDEVELCFSGTLDPAKVTGKIVLCLRGVNDRVDKSLAVSLAGGTGMILYNPDDVQALVTDNHSVPSVHVNNTDGLTVKAYIEAAGAGATASISASEKVDAQGSVMADFSSRGPNAGVMDIIKPDVTAPGVNILAGNSPTPFTGRPGQLFQSISGTSMSSPHVAGIFALMKEALPEWSPGAFKSALMTTARQDVVKEDTSTPADPFDIGAGHIVPNSALDPGLVYDTGFADYLAFLCGSAPQLLAPGTCEDLAEEGFSFDASDLNIASIAIADLVDEQTITRTVTSVTPGTTSWTAAINGVDGFSASAVAPFSIAEGESHAFEITFTTTTAAPETWSFGELVLSDGTHEVRSPIALRATAVDAPDEEVVEDAQASGETTFDVEVGYEGSLSADGFGMAADNDEIVHLNPDSDADIDTGTFTDGVVTNDFELAGAQYYAGGLIEDVNVVGDLDVFLFFDEDGDGFTIDDLLTQAADGDSNEVVELVNPEDGKYRLVLHGWGAPSGGVDVTRHQWTVDQDTPDTGSLIATAGSGDPLAVAPGDTVTVTAAWSGLSDPGEYRGVVSFSDQNGDTWDSTVLRVVRP